MTFLLILLVTGFIMWMLLRHPIKSAKTIGAVLGLLLLGAATLTLVLAGFVWLIE